MIVGFIVLVFIGMAAYFIFQHLLNPARSLHVSEWVNDPKAHQDWAIKAGSRCKDARSYFPQMVSLVIFGVILSGWVTIIRGLIFLPPPR